MKMKAVKKLVVLITGLAAATVSHATDVANEAYIAEAKRGPGIPAPVAVVTPEGHSAVAGDSAEVVLVVDASGQPTEVAVRSSTDHSFGAAAAAAVRKWRFEPAQVDGKSVAVKVVVPFKVARAETRGATFAARR